MPNKETFKINPIAELLGKYVKNGKNWIDPFSGWNSPAEYTNDLNEKAPTKLHLDAASFCRLYADNKFEGALFDPPYSLRQIKECYDSIGIPLSNEETNDASFSVVKSILARKIKKNGYAISFGWNSNGFGKNRGFRIIEILLVAHGGAHQDTICVVEQKL